MELSALDYAAQDANPRPPRRSADRAVEKARLLAEATAADVTTAAAALAALTDPAGPDREGLHELLARCENAWAAAEIARLEAEAEAGLLATD